MIFNKKLKQENDRLKREILGLEINYDNNETRLKLYTSLYESSSKHLKELESKLLKLSFENEGLNKQLNKIKNKKSDQEIDTYKEALSKLKFVFVNNRVSNLDEHLTLEKFLNTIESIKIQSLYSRLDNIIEFKVIDENIQIRLFISSGDLIGNTNEDLIEKIFNFVYKPDLKFKLINTTALSNIEFNLEDFLDIIKSENIIYFLNPIII